MDAQVDAHVNAQADPQADPQLNPQADTQFNSGAHPASLHASVWQASALARPVGLTVATGDAALDAQLPSGGWPVGALVEILQAQSGLGEWRLLLPALRQSRGPLVLVGPPHVPFGPALAAQGLAPERLLCVQGDAASLWPAARMWAAEQALRCADVSAVLAWLPLARADQLRRLHLAASEHGKLLFVMRPAQVQGESSPAVLRLLVSGGAGDQLSLRILKRRGPPLDELLTLPLRPARLAVALALAQVQVQVQVATKAREVAREIALDVAGVSALHPQAALRLLLPANDALNDTLNDAPNDTFLQGPQTCAA